MNIQLFIGRNKPTPGEAHSKYLYEKVSKKILLSTSTYKKSIGSEGVRKELDSTIHFPYTLDTWILTVNKEVKVLTLDSYQSFMDALNKNYFDFDKKSGRITFVKFNIEKISVPDPHSAKV